MYKVVEQCRICDNSDLESIIDLGTQCLTGVFPESPDDKVTSGPLELVKCHSVDSSKSVCELVQLRHSYDRNEMYGLNYGYRSGLNPSMKKHLCGIVNEVRSIVELKEGDLVLDIGSNDSTLLQAYPEKLGCWLVGIDPTGIKFKKYYPPHIDLIPEFFSRQAIFQAYKNKKAKVITSIAIFYDLEEPIDFVQNVYDILEDDGIWVLEQSYLYLMLEANAFDTICHEHLEYYGLKQIKWMMDEVGFNLIKVSLNDANGGSFRVTVGKNTSYQKDPEDLFITQLLEKESNNDNNEAFSLFVEHIDKSRSEIISLLSAINSRGEKIFGYGASTKGNVILQYCGLSRKDIPFIAEINEDKFGRVTPATHIPIISEQEAHNHKPDYFLVLPWHFKKGIVEKERDFLNQGGKLIFPLPEIEIIGQ